MVTDAVMEGAQSQTLDRPRFVYQDQREYPFIFGTWPACGRGHSRMPARARVIRVVTLYLIQCCITEHIHYNGYKNFREYLNECLYVCYSIVSASTPLFQGAFVVGGPCQVLEHSSCRGPSAFPPYQGVTVVAAACLRLQWGSVLTYSSRAERTEEGWAGCLYRVKKA